MTGLSIRRAFDRGAREGERPGVLAWAWARRHAIVGLGLVTAIWVAIIVFSSPWGRLWGTGQDAYCYWIPTYDQPYLRSDWTNPIAYVYSPAFLQLLAPIKVLPWEAYMAVWTGILLLAVRVLTGRRWFVVGVVLALMELAGGNIHLVLAAAMVLGFRWPWTWAIVLLTKITPGVGLLWFVVRREWRNLAIALGGTAAVVAVSFAIMPEAWFQWAEVLSRVAGRDGTWAAVPIPFVVRAPFAVVLVVWGAWTGRRWTVPVAGMLALPALWYGGLSMLLAVLVLRDPVEPARPITVRGRTFRASGPADGGVPAPAA